MCALALCACVTARCASSARHGVRIKQASVPMTAQASGALGFNFVQVMQGAHVLSANGSGVLPLGALTPVGGASLPGVEFEQSEKEHGVQTYLGIQLGKNAASAGSVILKAWLGAPVDPYQVFIDHVRLSSVPATLPAQTDADVTSHLVEIRLPDGAQIRDDQLKAVVLFQIVKN